jgi:hypothetical protein
MHMKRLFPILAALLLAACAAYSGSGLKPGEAGLDDVIRVMKEPTMHWQDPDGSVQLAYPRGPFGFHTFMVWIGPDGKLQRIGNVLDKNGFAQIQPGITQAQVLRVLGPPYPGWTVYFKARDELVWEWRYCDDWSEAARFNVLFDSITGTVRSTLSLTEAQRGLCGPDGCWCSR